MKKLKIKIFRNGNNNDDTLEIKVNSFVNNPSNEIVKINYLATSNIGSISIIVEYLEK